MSETIEKLSNDMLIFRAKHRMTQGELAERVGVCTQTINRIENCATKPEKITVVKIREVINQEKEI